ncbi:hypothetical protein HJC23_010845 [Cyclotella cryptica]|uniref:Glycosyltransferase family 32 protein n=1 Tax=Cyclotella cryptica TaxID=29204 RepID=A0ABD3QNV5_9STRA|eukprot:CCRYP_003600-RA/>CCRYP_003600-RA protein AED:0.31 eAED:0.31 QI:0/-1/0/1/-1/1/1/0/404
MSLPTNLEDGVSTQNNNSRRRRQHASSSDDAIAAAEAAANSINGGGDVMGNGKHHNRTPSKSIFSSWRKRSHAATTLRSGGGTLLLMHKHFPLRSMPKTYKIFLVLVVLLPLSILLITIASSHKTEPSNIHDGGIIYYPPKHTHPHVIPPTVIFTYHTNLLTTPSEQLPDEEDRALSLNVQHIVSLHYESTVRFLNDHDCKNSIRATLGPDTKLVEYFDSETHGMYKADICRGAALYETGGLYFDIDIEARMSLWDVIDKKTEFVTTLVHKDSNHLGGFFQAFIGVIPRHGVMKRYLELFVDYYEGRVKVNGPLGVLFLRMAYDELSEVNKGKTELWQEVRYSEKLFPGLKDPPVGKRRACQMLVVALKKKKEKKIGKKDIMIPFYSHARGSRMCGGKDTHKKG